MATPKAPARPAAPRRKPRPRASEATAGNPLEGTLPLRPRPEFSPYPDLSMAINMLERRKKNVKGERLAIITRWLEALGKMQAEMQKLHKLEVFADRLTSTE
ncbi:MAG: hypothetical protein GC129_02655 [Proteobacteria bacterium]|nr:hypothetical protein [Pseudomonadota bacterium]